MFGLQISQNIGSDPGWGVRKWRENFLHRWWCWRYPKVFTTRTTFCAKWRFWGRKLCCAFKHQNSDKLDKNSLCKNWCPLLIWQQNKRWSPEENITSDDASNAMKRLIHYLTSSLRQAAVLVTYVRLPLLLQPTHTHTHTHTPLCVFRFPVVRRGGWQECVCVYGVKVVRRLLWSDEGALEGEGTLCQLPGPGALKHWDFFFFFEYVRETVWVWCETMSRCNPEKTKRVILYWFALKESKRKENPASDWFTPLSLSSHFSVGISRQTWP